MSARDPFAALRLPFVRSFALGRVAAVIGVQIISVAVGWELYERTGKAFALGLVGLFELAPVLLFTFAAGNAADRYRRRNVAIASCPPPPRQERTSRDLFAGLSFIRRQPVFLAAVTLDMFAVLLGGAVALLPVFARDILHVGPVGLGWLRAAPSIGAVAMNLVATRLSPWKRPGRVLLVVVEGFGLAIIGFGLSPRFALSLVCLALSGRFDAISVVVRITLE